MERSTVVSMSVCMSVCSSVYEHISGTACPVFTKISVHVTYGRGSALARPGRSLQRRTLCRTPRTTSAAAVRLCRSHDANRLRGVAENRSPNFHSSLIARHQKRKTYRVFGSTLTAVGRSQLLARWPRTHCRILSGIHLAAQTVLGIYLKRTCSRVTSASSELGVLNDYALYKSTHSPTHSLTHSLTHQNQAQKTRLELEVDDKPVEECFRPNARTHAQTDGPSENIVPPAIFIVTHILAKKDQKSLDSTARVETKRTDGYDRSLYLAR